MHVIGKDIVKFHCIYYPLFLLAADLPLPKTVLTHCHWLKDGKKMSKSLGNVTCPLDLLQRYGEDSVRLYFLTDGPRNKDWNFDESKLRNLHNIFLADQYVNLINRVTGKKILQNVPSKLRSDQ